MTELIPSPNDGPMPQDRFMELVETMMNARSNIPVTYHVIEDLEGNEVEGLVFARREHRNAPTEIYLYFNVERWRDRNRGSSATSHSDRIRLFAMHDRTELVLKTVQDLLTPRAALLLRPETHRVRKRA